MSNFVNTIDLLGDEVVCASIIDRSITELKDDTVSKVDRYVFYGCKNLTKVEFLSYVEFDESSFNECSNLTVLILRSEIMCKLKNVTAFFGTPIRNGEGYIYVPSSLVSSYQSRWSSEKFRALEDYTVDGTTTGELDPTKI